MAYERLGKSSMSISLICLDAKTHFAQINPPNIWTYVKFTIIFIVTVQ